VITIIVVLAIFCGVCAGVSYHIGFKHGVRAERERRMLALNKARAEFARRIFEDEAIDDSTPARLNRGAFHVN
jgi:hypothetical protein